MSIPVTKPVVCPHCGVRGYFTAWESVDAAQDPELRERLLGRGLLAFDCPGCHGKSPVAYNLLYHDPARRCMIWLSVDDEAPPAAMQSAGRPYTLRLVKTADELIEKILLVEAGMDDRVMEVFKLALAGAIMAEESGTEGWLVFLGQDGAAGAALLFGLAGPGGQRTIRVARTEYASFAVQYGPRLAAPGGGWPVVDAAWALRAMESPANSN